MLARSVGPYGRHPILELAERGLLGPETVVAHAVHVEDADIAALAATGAAVAHCPRSNALLGCGVAPLARLRAAGIRVGLGTDSPSSALSLDMFDELRAALHARARERRRSRGALDRRRAADGHARRRPRARARRPRRARARACSPTSSRCGSTARRSGPATIPVSALVLGGSPALVTLVAIGGDVLYGVDSTEFERALPAAAAARSLLLEPAETPPT